MTPGDPVYSIGSPVFEYVSMELSNGQTLEIEARFASHENKYIQSATWNGANLNSHLISHEDIMMGGKLVLKMGPVANKSWGLE